MTPRKAAVLMFSALLATGISAGAQPGEYAGASLSFHAESASAAGGGMAMSGIPVHGNWCGPGVGGGPPTSNLHAACMAHDQCWERRGSMDCGCDLALLKVAEDASKHKSAGEVAAAAAVVAYFELAPCSFVPKDAPAPARWIGGAIAPVTGFFKHLFR